MQLRLQQFQLKVNLHQLQCQNLHWSLRLPHLHKNQLDQWCKQAWKICRQQNFFEIKCLWIGKYFTYWEHHKAKTFFVKIFDFLKCSSKVLEQ